MLSWLRNPWGRPRALVLITGAYIAWSILPVLVAILFAFNSGRSRTTWQGFSLRWFTGDKFGSVLHNPDLQSALKFVSSHDRTVLATRRADGRPQMSPVNSGLVDGAVCISSRAPLAKVRNIRRDPAVSVLIFTKEFFGSWVQIDGLAEIVDQPEALDLLVTVYRTIAGEHPDWDEERLQRETARRLSHGAV